MQHVTASFLAAIGRAPVEQGCLCRDCGDRYMVDLNIPDDLWVRIGMPTPGGLLCGQCIMRRVEGLGDFGALHVGEAEGCGE